MFLIFFNLPLFHFFFCISQNSSTVAQSVLFFLSFIVLYLIYLFSLYLILEQRNWVVCDHKLTASALDIQFLQIKELFFYEFN